MPDKVGFARAALVLLKISIKTSLLIFLSSLKVIFSSNSVSFPFIFVVYPDPNGLSFSPSFIVIEAILGDKILLRCLFSYILIDFGKRENAQQFFLLMIVSLFCERLILKLYSAKYRSMLNSDTQEYIPRIQDFT